MGAFSYLIKCMLMKKLVSLLVAENGFAWARRNRPSTASCRGCVVVAPPPATLLQEWTSRITLSLEIRQPQVGHLGFFG